MPKRDNFHETVKIALKKEGWNIRLVAMKPPLAAKKDFLSE